MSNKKKPNQQKLSPERYIREKARMLPIYKCYKGETIGDSREMAILVIRQHAGGTFTAGGYMLDRWCVGVKDALWRFSISEDEMEELVELFSQGLEQLTEVDYVEAHNWVYGALDWATNAGISPCKDFELAKYILEEDDEHIELREYEFGQNGEYCLMAKSHQEANKYIPYLEKALGSGNYKVFIRPVSEEEEETMDKWQRFDRFPEMKYTYKGGQYPKSIQLHHPEIEPIITMDMQKITTADIDFVLSFPADTLREDLQQLALYEMGRQCGMHNEQLQDDERHFNWNTIGNSFAFLTEVGTKEDTLPVLLEFLRQNDDVINFNEGDAGSVLIRPLVVKFGKEDPTVFKSFLLEKGLTANAKNELFEYMEYLGINYPDVRKPLLDMMHEVLAAYKADLPVRSMCDGDVVAFAIGVPSQLNATEFIPEIEELFATGMVNEGIEGDVAEVIERTMSPVHLEYHRFEPIDVYSTVKRYAEFYKSCN